MRRLFAGCSIVAWALVVASACEPDARVSERFAVGHVERLVKLTHEDVEEVRRGLPRGARALGRLWERQADLATEPGAMKRALDQVRGADRDLEVAKSTFFALTDPRGVVLASDQEPDRLSGHAVLGAFPALAQVLSGTAVETRGFLEEAAGARTGGDEQWLAAAPVSDQRGAVRGVYLSGWSMRRFAYHLEETLKHDLLTAALRSGDTRVKQPLLYAFAFAGRKVYGAPVTPLVNSEALEKLDLAAKTSNGQPFRAAIEITGRNYGVAAARAPELGPDAGVAVLRSET